MAKRGEVVDAETANKILTWWADVRRRNGRITEARGVIWPESRWLQARDATTIIDLSQLPCQRDLVHLVCMESGISVISVDPIPPDENHVLGCYGIQTCGFFASYDGLIYKSPTWLHVYVETEEAAEVMRRQYKGKSFESNVVALDRELNKEDLDDLHLYPLHWAVAAETWAFSPRTVFKARPTLRHTMNGAPAKREWPAIEIVNLRLPEKKENPDSEGRELTIRFYVKGHFRRQWRPSTKDHKLIWIDEHIRGPEDAPLKPKPTKVYKVTR